MAKASKQKIDRVPRQKVVQGASAIVTPKSPDYMFVKDNPLDRKSTRLNSSH